MMAAQPNGTPDAARLHEWQLRPDGPAYVPTVLPVRSVDGTAAAFKIAPLTGRRAGRRPRQLAGDRTAAPQRRPALRARPDAVQPLGRDRRRPLWRDAAAVLHAGGRGGFDEDRARAWVLRRVVVEATRMLNTDPAALTTYVALAKAVQDLTSNFTFEACFRW
jgi:hypothetical protein